MEASTVGSGSVCKAHLAHLRDRDGSWEWQRELEVFAGRISRGRAEEAAAARRASEEAERLALQRVQEAERRQLAWQSEESATLQTFLTGWHDALEARLDQMTAHMAAVQKRAEEDSSQALRNSTLLEALTLRMEKWEAKFQAELQELQDGLKEGQHRSVQQDDAVSRVTERLVACEANLEVVKEVKEALVVLEPRIAEVETRGASVAQTLRALEPFVEQVTARLEPLEPAIEHLRSELSASSQIHRTSIAAQGKQMEEGLKALQVELAKCQEDAPRLMRAIQDTEVMAEAATKHTTKLDLEMKEAAKNIHVRIQEVQDEVAAMAAQQGKSMEVQELRLSSLQSSSVTAKDLQSAEEKLRQDLRGEFEDGVGQAVAQAKESLVERLQREVDMLQRELQKQLQELRSSSSGSAEQLRSLHRENQKLADAFERTKGKGISFEWKIPRCLQRLRYLSLLSEAGLWLDSEAFYLGSLGPLEMRLYTKGLRGGNGQCAIALRFAEAGQLQGPVPLMVDLAVGENTRRAAQCADPEGLESLVWLADSMGCLEEHLVDDSEELTLRTELPLLVAPTMLASRAPSSMGSLDDLRSETGKQVPQMADAGHLRPAPGPPGFRAETRGFRDLRGVPSRDAGMPTLPLADPSNSGVFALRSWAAPMKTVGSTPLEELHTSIPGSQNQRNPIVVPDDAAR